MKCLFQDSRRWPSSPAWSLEHEAMTEPPPDDGLCAHFECVLLYVAQSCRTLANPPTLGRASSAAPGQDQDPQGAADPPV